MPDSRVPGAVSLKAIDDGLHDGFDRTRTLPEGDRAPERRVWIPHGRLADLWIKRGLRIRLEHLPLDPWDDLQAGYCCLTVEHDPFRLDSLEDEFACTYPLEQLGPWRRVTFGPQAQEVA